MRLSDFPLKTFKEVPAEAEVIRHQLMLRAGIVRRLASGLYTWLPLGLRYGPELLRFKDRHQREFCLGPTHEEVITDIARSDLKSYRQLPVNYYQIQTKFRDEIRPRFGVMRAREFTMKDAYSFHLDQDSLIEGYEKMRVAYDRIFTRMHLEFRIVCETDGFAANIETVAIPVGTDAPDEPKTDLELVSTPAIRTIEELSAFMDVEPSTCVKTLLVAGTESAAVALLLRGDHELNRLKAETLEGVARPLRMLRAAEVHEATGCEPGSLGPKDLQIPIYADQAAAALSDFVCGANKADHHLRGVNWERDLPSPAVADLRNAVAGDASPAGGGSLAIARGSEVGHIFQLGDKYSNAMEATVLDKDGKSRAMEMGCYGIGVTRVVAAAIEQNNDDRGIVWPEAIAPFDVVLIPINADKSYRVKEAAESLYQELQDAGFDALLDDRPQRPGVKFADADLIGIPHRLVIAEKAWDQGEVEYKLRRSPDTEMIPVTAVATFLGGNPAD
jgi:prolyl-tRNA synthetase